MNAARWLAAFACIVPAAGLWAQNPVLELERSDWDGGAPWTGRTALIFHVTVLHPSMRPGGSEDEFVFDPPGGWRGAVQLLVTDATGKSVDWPFENAGKDLDQPLSLDRLGTASVSFLLKPAASAAAFPSGKYQVRARLASTTGKWRGSVDSPPVSVQVVGREPPGLQVTGLSEGPLLRGWPLLVGVKLTAPGGYDGGLTLPTEEKDWAKVISLTLADSAGAPAALTVERLRFARDVLSQSQLKVLQSRTIWFRISGEATRSLGQGPYHWVAKFTLPASSGQTQIQWSGSVSATTAPTPVAAPPAVLSPELARRQTWAQVEDLLVEAKLIRDRTEGGYMNDRMMAARQSAVPLVNAERLALQWHNAHPDDAGGAVLMANVMAAQEDKARAIAYTQRAIDADQRQHPQVGKAASGSSLGLLVMARGFAAMPDEGHPVLTPELRAGLQQARAGGTPSTSNTPPAPVSAPVSPVPSVPSVATVPSTRAGEPSPGKVVPGIELVDAKIRADAAGQWAATATAGTQYGRTQYSAAQATGAPNINVQGNSPDAWCPVGQNEGTDWLEVSFAKPVHAIEVRVRQNDTSGAIAKIEAMEPDGTTHVWWEGADPAKASAVREIVWFAVRVPKTSYLVARVKLTLNLASGPGWKEIDAVQLVAAGDK